MMFQLVLGPCIGRDHPADSWCAMPRTKCSTHSSRPAGCRYVGRTAVVGKESQGGAHLLNRLLGHAGPPRRVPTGTWPGDPSTTSDGPLLGRQDHSIPREAHDELDAPLPEGPCAPTAPQGPKRSKCIPMASPPRSTRLLTLTLPRSRSSGGFSVGSSDQRRRRNQRSGGQGARQDDTRAGSHLALLQENEREPDRCEQLAPCSASARESEPSQPV
jgi:hypothetical protein